MLCCKCKKVQQEEHEHRRLVSMSAVADKDTRVVSNICHAGFHDDCSLGHVKCDCDCHSVIVVRGQDQTFENMLNSVGYELWSSGVTNSDKISAIVGAAFSGFGVSDKVLVENAVRACSAAVKRDHWSMWELLEDYQG